jgi:adenylate cyclase
MLRALGSAVRADVFQRVDRDLALMRPERRELVVYFGDIEGFTAVAQTQEPKVVVSVLQAYLGEMTTEVLDREGHVDKYLGDGLMAFWGAPVALADGAAMACNAALAMQARFEARRAGWEKTLGRPLVLRAALEQGPTLVGEMGTIHRVNYTVMGEPVATAFRLEGLAKKYDAHVLVGPGVAVAAGPRFVFRDVDVIRHHRSGEAVAVSELLGRAEDLAAEAPWLARHAEAMGRYRGRQFQAARDLFATLALEKPQDRLVGRYLARCQHYLGTPPGETWDGVYAGPEP